MAAEQYVELRNFRTGARIAIITRATGILRVQLPQLAASLAVFES
jgi:hypothetical protein